MNMNNIRLRLRLLALLVACAACSNPDIRITGKREGEPRIFPDYREVTVPCNIAPLNFSYLGDEESRLIVEDIDGSRRLSARQGLFSFPDRLWRELAERNKGRALRLTLAVRTADGWAAYAPFHIHIAPEPIDPYLSYRLIPPGYEGWRRMGIYERDLRTYEQTPVYENHLTDGNCVNCHAYCERDPSRMLFHARAGFDGTIVRRDGKTVRLDLPSGLLSGPLVYPAWHPSGRFVAFSTNRTRQDFLSSHADRVEVYDTASDLVVCDLEAHRLLRSPLVDAPDAFETFPAFSPDGTALYFCTAHAVDSLPARYREVRYDLCRIAFDPVARTFGTTVDTLFRASAQGKSVSFPRVSPDGRFLVFTLHDHGTFSIWHKDADLCLLDLRSGVVRPLAEANSADVESYHAWSGNSRWMVFSSRRTDGLYTRPFITYIDASGHARKPFLLPQKDPVAYYARLMYSYNIPELTSGRVEIDRHAVSKILRGAKRVSEKKQ